MKIVNYNCSLNCCNPYESNDCDIDLSCKCSLEELKHLQMMQMLQPNTDIYLNTEEQHINCKDEKKKHAKPKFGGMITLPSGEQVYIKSVIYSNPAVIVFWSDGKKTRSTCHEDDKFNGEFGLTLCVLKRFMSSEQLTMLLDDWFIEDVNDFKYFRIDLKDVRRASKIIDKISWFTTSNTI